MGESKTPSINDVVEALERLPDEVRFVVSREVLDRIADLNVSHLSDDQRQEVARRLAEPAGNASAADVAAFFARHGIET